MWYHRYNTEYIKWNSLTLAIARMNPNTTVLQSIVCNLFLQHELNIKNKLYNISSFDQLPPFPPPYVYNTYVYTGE